MRVPDPDLERRRTAGRLEKIRVALDLEPGAMAELLGLKPAQYGSIISGRSSLLAPALYRLIETLQVDYEAFAQGRLDYQALAERLNGNRAYLPEKYRVAAFTKRRVIANILAYCEQVMRGGIRERVNRRFQISDQVWQREDEWINIRFGTELLEYLRRQGASREAFFWMGQYMIVSAAGAPNPLREQLSGCQGTEALYELFFTEVGRLLEKNHHYRILFQQPELMVVESRTNREVAGALGLRQLGSKDSCRVRAGTISSLPGFIGQPFSRVRESACVHEGDSCCRFEIHYPTRPEPLPILQ